MKRMVRKQLYLTLEQNILLQKLAKQRGVSESEIIRQSFEHEVANEASVAYFSEKSFYDALAFVADRKAKYAGQGEPVIWNREELYERSKTLK